MMNSAAFSKVKHIALSVAVLSAAIASSVVFSNSANAQSAKGQTKIDFNVKPFVRLYYKESVTITLSPSKGYENGSESQAGVSLGATYDPAAGVSGGGDVGVTSSKQNASGSITLKNFWAFQSIAEKGTKVTVSADKQEVFGPNKNSIVMSAINDSKEYAPTGLAATQFGDATLNIDMTNAKYAGSYSGAIVNITAENF